MAEAVAPVSLTASATVANTGCPKCVSPAFLGFVPPTTFVPDENQQYFLIEKSFPVRTIFDSLLSVKSRKHDSVIIPHDLLEAFDVRSLLSCEPLEDHFGVAIDPQILVGRCISRSRSRIGLPSGSRS